TRTMELTKSQISDNTAFLLTTPITYGVKRWGKKKLLGDSENYLREV
ncbi:hypothetical protein HMPREF9999_00773, partial [Alloprevotella sp. oral taxon 473 str. F0040]